MRRISYREIQQLVGRTLLLSMARYAHLIPRRGVRPLATVVGSLVMFLSPRHRRIVMDNLNTAFGREKSELERRVIARRFYRNLATSLIEFLRMPATSRQEILDTVQLQGVRHIDEAVARGKGVILMTAHYGNWEIFGARLALACRRPLNVIARNQRDQEVTDLMNALRAHGGMNVIPREQALRECMRRLRANEIVAILIDQNAGDSGVFVDFFGKLASTAPGTAVFAYRTSAAVLPIFCVRQPDGTHVGEIHPPIELVRTNDVKADIVTNTAVFTKTVEEAIRRHPDHWFWMHRRWKARPPGERREASS